MSRKAQNSEHLRAAADAAVTRWRELAATVERLETELAAYRRTNPLPPGTYAAGMLQIPSDNLIGDLERQATLADSRAAAAVAEREAVVALDVLELAEGDEAARARDLPTLRADLVELDGDVQRARDALNAAVTRMNDRAAAAVAATATVARRRAAAGLPFVSSGFDPRPHRSHLTSVDEAMARGVPLPGHAAAAENARAEIRRVASRLEEERREKEEHEREIAALRRQRLDEAQESDKRMRQRAEADRREQEKERAAREKLADDYLSRRAGAAQ